MPIFEFVCGGCSRQFEEIMTFAQINAGDAVCPDCGSKKVERNLSTFASSTGGAESGPACGGGGGFT